MDDDEECHAILLPDEELAAICSSSSSAGNIVACDAAEGEAAPAPVLVTPAGGGEIVMKEGSGVMVKGGKYNGETGTVRSVGARTCRLTLWGGGRTGNIKKQQLTVVDTVAHAGYGALASEVLVMIFDCLDHYEDISRARCVCTAWRDAVPFCRMMQHLQISVDMMLPREAKSRIEAGEYMAMESSNECSCGTRVEVTYMASDDRYIGHRGTVQGIHGDTITVLLPDLQETVNFWKSHLVCVPTLHGGARWRAVQFCNFVASTAVPRSARVVSNSALEQLKDKLAGKSLFDCSKLETLKVLGAPPEWFVDLSSCAVLKKLTLIATRQTGFPSCNIPNPLTALKYTFSCNGPVISLQYLSVQNVFIEDGMFENGALAGLLYLQLIQRSNQNPEASMTASVKEALLNCPLLETLCIEDRHSYNEPIPLVSSTLKAIVLRGKGFWLCCREQDVPLLKIWDASSHFETRALGGSNGFRRGQCNYGSCQRCLGEGAKQYSNLNAYENYLGEDGLSGWDYY